MTMTVHVKLKECNIFDYLFFFFVMMMIMIVIEMVMMTVMVVMMAMVMMRIKATLVILAQSLNFIAPLLMVQAWDFCFPAQASTQLCIMWREHSR